MNAARPSVLRVLIVDDEPLARCRTRLMLERIGGVEIIGEAAGGHEGLRLIESLAPDVVLLDIQMPDMDGLRLLEALDDPPAVIFSTAYGEHALKAFDLEATDYLLKPYSAARMERALERVRKLSHGTFSSKSEVRVPLQDGLTTVLVPAEQIVSCKIMESVVFVTRSDGEQLIHMDTLGDLLAQLPEDSFVRINRQVVVNLLHVCSFTPTEEGGLKLSLTRGAEEVASRRRAHELRIRLGG